MWIKIETIDLFIYLSKYTSITLIIKTFIREKASYWYHTDHSSNSELCHQNKFCITAFDQSGLNNQATQNKKISLRLKYPRIIQDDTTQNLFRTYK